jgi:hypothetical protein
VTNSYLITVPGFEARRDATIAHLDGCGFNRSNFFHQFVGVNGETAGLSCTNTHALPDGTIYTPTPKHVSLCLNHWFLWQRIWADVMTSEGDFSIILEDDVRFTDNWHSKYTKAIEDVPGDWDILFLGSCYARNFPVAHIAGDIWKVEKPNCTHAYCVRNKALPVLIEKCHRIYTNIDWAIIEQAIPHLKTFAVLPRLAHQHGMEDLPE